MASRKVAKKARTSPAKNWVRATNEALEDFESNHCTLAFVLYGAGFLGIVYAFLVFGTFFGAF